MPLPTLKLPLSDSHDIITVQWGGGADFRLDKSWDFLKSSPIHEYSDVPLYIPSGIYPHRRNFGKFCSEIRNLNENSKGIYIPLYPLFENFGNFVKCPAIYPGIYRGTSLYSICRNNFSFFADRRGRPTWRACNVSHRFFLQSGSSKLVFVTL